MGVASIQSVYVLKSQLIHPLLAKVFPSQLIQCRDILRQKLETLESMVLSFLSLVFVRGSYVDSCLKSQISPASYSNTLQLEFGRDLQEF